MVCLSNSFFGVKKAPFKQTNKTKVVKKYLRICEPNSLNKREEKAESSALVIETAASLIKLDGSTK